MKHFTRRNFVKVGAGLVAFVPAMKELASTNVSYAASVFSENQTPANYFVAGQILSVRGDNLLIEDEEHLVTQVNVTSSTQLWRGGWISSTAQVKAGDHLYTRGALQGSTLHAAYAWVNIANLSGVVTGVEAGAVQLQGKSGTHEVRLNAQTERFFGSKLQPDAAIAEASGLQVIGLWDEHTQSLTATKLFLPNSAEEQPIQVDQAAPAFAHVYYGVASWFCCGSSWGPCGAAGHGACGTCNSNQYHCAWPNLGTGCRFVGCGRSQANVSCGHTIQVHGQCSGHTINTTVADCGPNEPQLCNSTSSDCRHYVGVMIDLTPAAFSAIAPLSEGLASVSASF